MVKKPQPKRPASSEKLKTTLSGVGSFLKTALSSHPAVAGMTIMAAATVGRIILLSNDPDQKGDRTRAIAGELSNAYAGAQGVVIAMAAVPLVQSALQFGTSALSAKAGMPTNSPKSPPARTTNIPEGYDL